MLTPVTTALVTLISIAPHGSLSDGQIVKIRGRHFEPNRQIVLSECRLRGGRCPLPGSCPGRCTGPNSWTVTVRDSGTFVASYAPARFIQVGRRRVDCAVQRCALVTQEGINPAQSRPLRLRFKRGARRAPLELLRFAVDRRAHVDPRTGAAVVSGSVHCNRRGLVTVNAQVRENGGAASLPLQGSGDSAAIVCRPGSNRWHLEAFAAGGSYVAGRVAVSAGANGLPESPSSAAFKNTRASLTLATRAKPSYYVALGDSLAVGVNSSPGASYVQDLFRARAPAAPGLTLVDFGCSGETSGSLLTGQVAVTGGACSYPGGGAQLDAAERFLRAHSGRIALVTIDIGGNDLVACGGGPAPDPACQMRAFDALKSNLAQITQRLRDAVGASVPIASMTYFDPFLLTWFNGQAGQERARGSVQGDDQVSAVIRDAYSRIGAPVADVEGAFGTSNFDLVPDTPWGTIPFSVERACRWLGGCPLARQPFGAGFSDDTNDAGSRVIAQAFARALPSP
jgi:lysophospholipase L1-like esterase